MIDIISIKLLCEAQSLRWTNHIAVRLMQRRIETGDILYALVNGEIIEQYPDDYPYPSCLVLGLTEDQQPLHVVCGMGDGELWLVTAYYPDTDEWTDDFRSRREDNQ